MRKNYVYISGALTGLENPLEVKMFYEKIASICNLMQFQTYVPHINTDPINHPNVTPREVFETDKEQVSKAELVIAYLGFPSFGVGMELAYADERNIPIILLYEKEKNISRFPRGIPSVIAEILFNNYEDALIRLKNFLQQWKLQQMS